MMNSLNARALVCAGVGCCSALVALVILFPQYFGIRAFSGFVHMSAFAGPIAIGVTIIGALITPVLFCLGRGSAHSKKRLTWCVLAGFCLVTLVASIAQISGGAGRSGSQPVASENPVDIRVISANVYYANTDYATVVARVSGSERFIISLQEAQRTEVEAQLARHGLATNVTVSTPTPLAAHFGNDSVLIVSNNLEPKEHDYGDLGIATAGLRTAIGDVFSVHTHSPVSRSVVQRDWYESVRTAVNLCQGYAALLTGDFNATRSHMALPSECQSAAQVLGFGNAGTWPSNIPVVLGTQIDHQLSTNRALVPQSGEVFDVPGSDHRGLDITYEWNRSAP